MTYGRVDVVVVGDSRCGKTSLVTTLVSSIFPESVPHVLQQVRVPPEETSDNIALSITDTSSSPEDRIQTMQQVAQANVILLVYNAALSDSLSRLADNWLVEIKRVSSCPIVLVGNKTDIQSGDNKTSIETLMKSFPQIDASWQCSAKLNMNVAEVFASAQQVVVHPVAPLFNTQSMELQPKFITALTRVFRIFDRDRDGVLSDSELNDFQATCFGARLQPSDIEDVRAMLAREGKDRVTVAGITLLGFMCIHRRFIDRNRSETCWLVLRQFGYDQDLQLQIPTRMFEMGSRYSRDISFELAKTSQMFLADVFHQFDQDRDQALNAKELENLFSICPNGLAPWELLKESCFHPGLPEDGMTLFHQLLTDRFAPGDTILSDFGDKFITRRDALGNITLPGWLGVWTMLTLLRPKIVVAYLYFLGDDMNKPVVHMTRRRSIEDESNNLQRNVIRGFVFGAHGVGKSTLLSGLVSNGDITGMQDISDDVRNHKSGAASAIGRIKQDSKTNIHLVLTEVAGELLSLEQAFSCQMVDCDIAILLFDSSNPSSVDWLQRIQQRIPDTVPCVYLATKIDTIEGNSQAVSEASVICLSNSLPEPEPICLVPKTGKQRQKLIRLFELCANVALHPDVARPISEEKRALQRRGRILRASLRISVVGVLAFSACAFLWSRSKTRSNMSD